MNRALIAAGGLVISLLAARGARGDVVPPPPKDCPPGTHGATGHAGPGCVPNQCPPGAYGTICAGGPCCVVLECGGDAGRGCASASACETARLCVRQRMTIGWGGRRLPVKEALSTCDANGACAGEGSCEALQACVVRPADAGASAQPDAGGGATAKADAGTGTGAQEKGKTAGGCGCLVGASPPGGLGGAPAVTLMTTLAAALAAWRRRRAGSR